MEEHAILSERLEDQLKAVEWAKAEQKRILKEKGERLSKELMEKMTPFILNQQKGQRFPGSIEWKATDQMKWIGLMNNVLSSTEEIVVKELIYA